MRKLLAVAAFGLALTQGAGAAEACRIRWPEPPVIRFPYQALAIGTVLRIDAASNRAEIRIERVVDGQVRTRRLHVPVSPEIVLSCTRSYEMHVGDRLFLTLRQSEADPTAPAWLPLDVARDRERLIADYLAAGSGSDRRRVVARWREQHGAELAVRQ